jgi:hypothetical protein
VVSLISSSGGYIDGRNSANLGLLIDKTSSPELEIKETTDTASFASYLDLYLEFDDSGQLTTKIYDKRDDFNFKIINFLNMCSNIPASPAYNPSFIIVSADSEYFSTRSWYRNINFLRDRIRRIF